MSAQSGTAKYRCDIGKVSYVGGAGSAEVGTCFVSNHHVSFNEVRKKRNKYLHRLRQ